MLAYEVAVTTIGPDGDIIAEWSVFTSFDRSEAEKVYVALKPINKTAELREWKCEDDDYFTDPINAIEFSKEFELIEPDSEPNKEETGYQIYVKRPGEKAYTKWFSDDSLNWFSDEEKASKRAAELTDFWKSWGDYHYIAVACRRHTK